jgi:hypothetical protein
MALKFRRGTTAQKSGSLAFGEPYVNTTLGTLQIGLESGDATLTALGTGSSIAVAGISGSSLDITGYAKIDGRVNVGLAVSASGLNINKTDGNVQIELSNSTNGRGFHLISYNGDSFSIHNPHTGLSTFRIDSGSQYHSHFFGDVNIQSGSIRVQNGITGSLSGSVIGIGNVTAYSSSVESKFTTLATLTGSNSIRLTNLETFSGSENSKAATLATYTASVDGRFTSLATITGSLISSASNLTQRVAANEAVSGTFARTNSANVFTGNQTITGSLYITQDLVIGGSASIQTISSSRLDIGDNIIQLNVNSPSLRFGGLTINDSGSVGNSGSFLYDSLHDEFIFVHKGNGTNVTSSHFVLGPETYDNLGTETYLTNNRLPKGSGKEHLNDSQISDDGTTVSIGGALTVTGNITGPIRATNGVVSGSSQITYASISSIPAGIVSGSSQLTSILPAGVISGSSQVVGSSITTNTITIGSTSTALGGTSTTIAGLTSVTSTGFTGALTGNASTATTLATARTINGTSFNGSADITIANLVSGSSQITATSTTGFATGVKTQLDANTVVSGSAQINVASTTGDIALGTRTSGNYVASMTAGTGITVGTATGEGSTPVITNTGVTSVSAGTGITLGNTTGACSIAIGQSVATSANAQFNSLGIGMAASATAGRIDATNDIVAYSSSDIRFKENIKPIENALDKIRKISGNTYDWKAENKVEHGYEGNDVGVIAQEVEAVLPQLVQTRESGYKAVKYDKLVALLIEGIKEQQLQIEQLRIDLDNCRNKGL